MQGGAWGLGALLLILGVLNFAEFRMPQLKPRLAAALAQIDPDLEIEAGEVFLAVQVFQGRIRARLKEAKVRHPAFGTRALSIAALSLDMPLTAPLQKQGQLRALRLSGVRLRMNMSPAVVEALPHPSAQGPVKNYTAEDFWGLVFYDVFHDETLRDVVAQLPATLPRQTWAADVQIEVYDPPGQRLLFTAILDSGQQRLRASGAGHRGDLGDLGDLVPDVRLSGHVRAPQGQTTPLEIQAKMAGDGSARLSLRAGQLVPAHYYELLRFAQFATPERLTTAYRLHMEARFPGGGQARTARLDIIEIDTAGQERPFAVLQGQADPQSDRFTLRGDLAALNLARVAPWTPVPSLMQEMHLALSGSFVFDWDRLSNDWLASFEVTRGSGTLAIPALGLPSAPGGMIGVRDMHATGRVDARGLRLDQVHLATGSRDQAGPILDAQLSVLSSPQSPEQGPEIALEMRTAALQRGDLFYLWPTRVAAQTRQQVSAFIEAGAFSDLLFAGTYRLEGQGKTPGQLGVFVRQHQEIRADFDQGQVRLTQHLPIFTQARGRLKLVDDGLDIHLEAADFGPASLADGHTYIDFSTPDWIAVTMAGQMQGPLSPALSALAEGHIGLTALRALPLDRMRGQAQGRLNLALGFDPRTIADSGIAREHIKIDTQLAISGLNVRDYILGTGVRSGHLDLHLTDQGLSGEGLVDLDGVEGRVEIAQTFDAVAPLRVTATARVPAQRAGQFLPGLAPYLSGEADGRFEYRVQAGEAGVLAVDLDLAQVAADVPALAYAKAAGQPGRLQLDVVIGANSPLEVDNIQLNAPGLASAGRLTLSDQGWRRLALSRVRVHSSDVRDLVVENLAHQLSVTLGGGVLDLEPFLDRLAPASPASSHDVGTAAGTQAQGGLSLALGKLTKPLVVEQAQLSRLHMDPEAFLTDVAFSLVAGDDGLRGLALRAGLPSIESGAGHAGAATVQAQVRGTREAGYGLTLTTDDFGALLHALGLSEDVREGTAQITGQSPYPIGGGPWRLAAEAQDFRILDTPALVQLASAISLTGILEQLGGTGLSINTLEFRGTLAAPALHVQRAKMDGPSLGFSIAGVLDWKKKTLNFRGALLLLNLVNMAVRDIPLLGPLLTGANSQGLIATQFQISGVFSDMKMQVDPLSTIQPGLLRSLIDKIEGQDY